MNNGKHALGFEKKRGQAPRNNNHHTPSPTTNSLKAKDRQVASKISTTKKFTIGTSIEPITFEWVTYIKDGKGRHWCEACDGYHK